MRKMATLLTVMLALCVQVGFAQQQTITGVVRDAGTNNPLPGISVVEKGTTNGTATDFEGRFEITVTSDNPVLEFSGIGRENKEVAVGSEDFLTVLLDETSEALDEVVITALGISKQKKALGYAVSEVSGDEVEKSNSNNVIQSLNAKAPGIQVVSSGGTPGASSKILLRGNATFTGQNQPLIVIDGVPIDNTTTQSSPRDYPFNENLQGVNSTNRAFDINPDDIESVTVLKGPAAAALYGARAGNGAIIYTTKRGKAGRKKGLGVTVSQDVTFNQVNKLPDLQSTYAQGVGGGVPGQDTTAVFVEGDPGPDNRYLTADDVSLGTSSSWGPSLSSLGMPSYDNPDNFFETGVSSKTNVAISGGNEKSGVRLSIGYLSDQGMIPNTNANRASVRLTADTRLSEKVRVGGTMNYINTQSTLVQNGSNLAGVMLGLMRAPASYDITDYIYDNGFQRTYFYAYDNPFYTVYENPFTSNINRVLGNVYVDYAVTDWLNLNYKIGADAYVDDRKQIFAVSSFGDDIGGVGQVNENKLTNRTIYADFLARMNKNFGEDWTATLTLGHNVYSEEFSDLFGRGRRLAVPGFYNMVNASDLYTSEYTEVVNTMALFGQLEIDWKSTFFINLTGRNEWSSTFELDNNSFFYPSASASLVFTEFWDDRPDWFDFGKVRYSYAQTGISPIPYSTRSIYTTPFYTDGFTNGLTFPFTPTRGPSAGTPVNGFRVSPTLFTPDLNPEILTGNEVGVNLIFMDRKIDLDFTYYHQLTTDALLFQPLANSSGYDQAYVNGGEILNRGYEIALNLRPVTTDDFSWRVNLNWSKNISEVQQLVPGVDQFSIEAAFSSIGSFAIVGQPYGVFYGTVWERDNEGNILVNSNGIPIVSSETQGVGDPNPDWLAGVRNTFDYKGLELSFFFDFRKGGDVYNGTYARLNSLGRTEESAENRTGTYLVDGVYADGVVVGGEDVSGQPNETEISAIQYYQQVVGDFGGASEEFVEEVNWARLRDVSLSYRFDLSDRTFLHYVDLAVTGRNLILWTDYNGVDPETSLTGAGSNIGGLDYFNNPGSRSFGFRVKFGF